MWWLCLFVTLNILVLIWTVCQTHSEEVTVNKNSFVELNFSLVLGNIEILKW